MAEFRVLSTSDFNPAVPGYRKRKAIARTRAGCLSCKAKKVKCDETRPSCVRCTRNSWRCVYDRHLHAVDRSPAGQKSTKPGFSTLSHVTVLPFATPTAKNGTSSYHLIQHCLTSWTDIFHIAPCDEIISQFRASTPVRNVILAIAACHLRHLSPGVVQHRVAEHFQQSLAIHEQRELLAKPLRELGQSGVNSMLLSATLLNVLGFPLPILEAGPADDKPAPDISRISIAHSDQLGWLALQAGVRPLMRSMGLYFEEAMNYLKPIFLNYAETPWDPASEGMDIIPEIWVRFFELDDAADTSGETTRSMDNKTPGHSPPIRRTIRSLVKVVASLRHVEPTPPNAFLYITFLAKTQREFRRLLLDGNEKALWLYGYWFGLLCRFEGVWWCRQRAWRDYTAILSWLQHLSLASIPGPEGEMWIEMMTELELAPYYVTH